MFDLERDLAPATAYYRTVLVRAFGQVTDAQWEIAKAGLIAHNRCAIGAAIQELARANAIVVQSNVNLDAAVRALQEVLFEKRPPEGNA